MKFSVENSSVHKFEKNLEKLSQGRFTAVVRNCLNDTVYAMKKKSINDAFSNEFARRENKFVKATTTFINSKGNRLEDLKAIVGFKDVNAKKNPRAVKELEEQEHGGKIPEKMIAMSNAREGRGTGMVLHRYQQANITSRLTDKAFDLRDKGLMSKRDYAIYLANLSKKVGKDSPFLVKQKIGSKSYIREFTKHDSFRERNGMRFKSKSKSLYRLFDSPMNVRIEKTEFMKRVSIQEGNLIAYRFEARLDKILNTLSSGI